MSDSCFRMDAGNGGRCRLQPRETRGIEAIRGSWHIVCLGCLEWKRTIRTDLGKPIYLEVKKPDLIRNLSVGDRVTIQLNEDGQVDKIMGASVPELAVTGQPMPETISK